MKLTEKIEVSNYSDVVLNPGTVDALHWIKHSCIDEGRDAFCLVHDRAINGHRTYGNGHTEEDMAKMIKHYIQVGARIIVSNGTINIKCSRYGTI